MSRNCLTICLLGIAITVLTPIVAREAIIGARKATPDQFPYQVAIRYNGTLECGAGIIAAQYILTAAHCVIDDDNHFKTYNIITILAGTIDLHHTSHPAVVEDIQKIFVPKEYNPENIETTGDIAVIKLRNPLKLSEHIKQLALPPHENSNYDDKIAEIAGWGWSYIKIKGREEYGGLTGTLLRFSVANVLSNEKCQKDYPKSTINVKEMCARVIQKDNYHRGVCTGDSGGPLVHDHIVIGILSISPTGCSELRKAGIYTRVSHYLDFIHLALQDPQQHDDMRIEEVKHK